MRKRTERIGRIFDDRKQIIIIICFAIAFITRFFMLGRIPDGLNQDEAYAAYEAYSLLHFGKDSWGYSFPVYLTTWGSGMNAMSSYLMIPFIAVLGPVELAVRLPQAIMGFVAIIVFYKLFAYMFPSDNIIRILALFIVAINPWHILMCRFALESNMAPAFILIAFYFFCKGVHNPKFYMLSALFYGLSLYCYALAWILIPVFLLFQIIYLIWTNSLRFSKYLVFSVGILFVIALPLLLFVMVNSGKIDEIRTSVISIPRMPMFRASEIDFGNKKYRLFTFIKSMLYQNDGLSWNYAGPFGIYYIWGLPFAFIGFISLTVKAFRSLFKRTFHAEVMFLIPFAVCMLFSCTLDTNFNKMNSIHFPIIAMIVIGFDRCIKMFKNLKIRSCLCFGIAMLGVVSLLFLERYYYTGYSTENAGNFKTGFRECLDYAEEVAGDGTVYISDYSSHPCVLFYRQISPEDKNLRISRESGITADHISNYDFLFSEASEGDYCIIYSDYPPAWYAEADLLFSSGKYMVVLKPQE